MRNLGHQSQHTPTVQPLRGRLGFLAGGCLSRKRCRLGITLDNSKLYYNIGHRY